MRIEFTRTVKHNGLIYTKGDLVTVDDGLGTYFLACGWATDVTGVTVTADVSPVVLDVQSAVHKTEVKYG